MQRWDLVAQFPELEEEILELPNYIDNRQLSNYASSRDAYRLNLDPLLQDNKVSVYHFFLNLPLLCLTGVTLFLVKTIRFSMIVLNLTSIRVCLSHLFCGSS